jgi:trimeric autotransporter adhesin
VFIDYNADGTRSIDDDQGLSNINVQAIDCVGNRYTVSTDRYGDYSIAVPTANYPVRLEFSNVPSGFRQGTLNGTDGRTSVQFVAGPSCSNDFGVLSPSDFCQNNPKMFVPCYAYGDPLAPGGALSLTSVSGEQDALVGFDYTAAGVKDASKISTMIKAREVGTLWGVAYDKNRKHFFSSAVLKRHAGLGPLGLGGIYYTNPVSGSTTPLLSVTALGVDVGSIGTNASRGLVASLGPSVDLEGWDKSAIVGIGDLDINETSNRLYFTNLHDRKLYSVTISGGANNVTLSNAVGYTLPVTCTNGVLRPWGLKVYLGKVYIGAVCDASISQSKVDLRAYVLEFNPATNAFTPVFDFPLTYPKGFIARTFPSRTGWYPWSDRSNTLANVQLKQVNATGIIYPEPILTDIEFDTDGSLVLGFGDVTGFQTGFQNFTPVTVPGSTTVNGLAGGDLLRAYVSAGSYVLENNAKAGPSSGYGTGNNQGPGFGEFYNDDYFSAGNLTHAENVFGGLALRPGSGEIVVTCMDPITNNGNAGGVRHLSNTTGDTRYGFELYATQRGSAGTFAKAIGLGDIELTCDLPEFQQIGNRVWKDTDGDGEQDACEEPLAGVNVTLYQSGTIVTSTVTDANGEYYFTYVPASSTLSFPGSTSLLLPTTTYQIVFGTNGQFASNTLTVGGGNYLLTTTNATGGNLNSRNDSDVRLVTIGGVPMPTIPVTTGPLGSVNHTLDAGFICAPTAGVVSTSMATCNAATPRNDAVVSVSAITNANRVFLVAAGGAIPSYTATGSQPVSNSAASFTGLSNPSSTSGQSYSVVLYNGPCCFTIIETRLPQTQCVCSLSLTLGTPLCNSATNQYTISGTVSFTGAGNTITLSDGATTTALSTSGTSPLAFTLTGSSLLSNASSHTLTASASSTASCVVSASYTAPPSCQPLASLGNYVFLDNDRNGLQSAGDDPIPNVVVTLFRNGSAVATTTTDASGLYSFTGLTPGSSNSYSVGFTRPSGVEATTANVGGAANDALDSDADPITGRTSNYTLSPGENNTTIDAGYTYLPCSATVSITNSPCSTVTNGYSSTAVVRVTNTGAGGTLTVANGPQSLTTNVPGGLSSYTFTASFGNLPSTGASVSVVASLPTGCSATTTYTAPASCSVAPPCSASVSVTRGLCQSATNTYSATVVVQLTNPTPGVLTVSNTASPTAFTANVPSGLSSYSFTAVYANTLPSNGSVVTVTASLTSGCESTTIYAAPTSCTIAALASLGNYAWFDTNRNGIQDDGTTGIQDVVVTLFRNGTVVTTTATDATGFYSFTGLTPGTSNSYSVGFTSPANYSLTQQNAPGSTTANNSDANPLTGRTQSVTLAPGEFNPNLDAGFNLKPASLGNYVFSDNNKDGIQNGDDTPLPGVVVTLFQNGSVVATTRTNGAGAYSFTGLAPGTSVGYQVGFTTPAGYSVTTPNAPGSTTATDSDLLPTGRTQSVTLVPGEVNTTLDAGFLPPTPSYALTKTVDKKIVEKGQFVTYTVSLTNTSVAASGTLVLTDQISTSAVTLMGSATTSVGTFAAETDGGTWTIPNLTSGQVATLSFMAQLTEEGITYNTITLPGQQTATTCASVPAHVCVGTPFQFDLTAPASYSTYQWSRNGVVIPGATSAIYSATSAGEYTVSTTATAGCVDGSCCPFIVVEDPLPSLTAVVVQATCVGVTPQNNAQITLTGSNTAAISYNITAASSFSAGTPLYSSPQPLSAVQNGILLGGIANPTQPVDYTIRVYSAQGCFADYVVRLLPTVCNCPPAKCVPYVVRKTK